ncbi:MAG: MarR family protein [Candidatus Scalindua rubra]|uniref:MarR family protein n=1 Tax=Candidatus Scalindua rubra TaxID=1872076 RepID=A0A1E3XCY5_9BACT|nr:MAG: MarR family protein [Candidatus Scalindua rubra]
MVWQSPISSKDMLSTTRMIWKTWDDKTKGNLLQVKKIIEHLEGIKEQEIASFLTIPDRYAGEICDTLLKDGHIVRSARGGYAVKRDLPKEIMDLVRMRRVVYVDEISRELSISPEAALGLASGLVEAGFLIRTSKGGYLFKNDREIILMTIKRLKDVIPEEIAKELKIPEKYTTLLCQILEDEFLILKTKMGKYIPAENRITKLLKLIRKSGLATADTVGRNVGITPAYAGLLCDSLVKDGYLRKTKSEAGEVYTLVR